MSYPEIFKKSVVSKLLSPGGPSERELLAEAGISKSTLHRWKSIYTKGSTRKMKKSRTRRPKEWTPEEKLGAVAETATLDEVALGAWCRSKGVHVSQLCIWREQFLASVRKAPRWIRKRKPCSKS